MGRIKGQSCPMALPDQPPLVEPLAPGHGLYFLHIPKTAGSASRDAIASCFHPTDVQVVNTLPDLAPIRPGIVSSARFISGHLGRLVSVSARQPLRTITLLREPMSRALSHLRHLRVRGIDDGTLTPIVQSMGIDAFVRSDIGACELRNVQTRQLGQTDPSEAMDLIRNRGTEGARLSACSGRRALLDEAKRALEGAWRVGVQDDVAGFVSAVRVGLGWPPAARVERANTAEDMGAQGASAGGASGSVSGGLSEPGAPADDVLEAETRARLEDLQDLDLPLWDFARQLVASRAEAFSPRAIESAYRAFMAQQQRIGECELTMDMPIRGLGWLWPERSEAGEWWRWMGPEPSASIDLPLAEGRDLQLRFAAAAQTPDVVSSLRIEANGHPLELDRWQVPWAMCGPTQCNAVIPARAIAAGAGMTRLAFHVGRVVQPASEWPGHGDTRKLGLYLGWVRIEPA